MKFELEHGQYIQRKKVPHLNAELERNFKRGSALKTKQPETLGDPDFYLAAGKSKVRTEGNRPKIPDFVYRIDPRTCHQLLLPTWASDPLSSARPENWIAEW